MPISREFLDWRRPALAEAAQWLIAFARRRGPADSADLRQALVVVPGRRAGRRLLELLVQQAEEAGVVLSPPEILTEGAFPEKLYTPQKPFANKLTQQLAWAKALQETPAAVRKKILPQSPPKDDVRRWLALGDSLRKQHLSLAADGYDFTDVAQKGAELTGFDERPRWEALAKVQEQYHKLLDAEKLWDVQSARLVAIERGEPRTDRPIFLLGTVDLNQALRQMLDQVAEHVTALIAAPKELQDAFDDHGCLKIDFWHDRHLPLVDEKVFTADSPADQAVETARRLAAFNAKYRPDEITLGVADETLVPQVQRQLDDYGVPTRWVVGRKLAETAPWRFLAAAAEFVSDRRFSSLASLVRHPDVHDYLRRQLPSENGHDLLTELDNYCNDHLPRFVEDEWLGNPDEYQVPRDIFLLVKKLLFALYGPPQPLSTWCGKIRELLATLYGQRSLQTNLPADRELLEVGRVLEKALADLEKVPQDLQPKVTVADALEMILEPLEDETIPPPPNPEAIEMLGWLELALDDAPALVVLNFNEGYVPKSYHSDAFLPNRLREHLHLEDNRRRYARDAYAVEAILNSRPEVSWIVGRRDHDGNPLAPSRLLFATDEQTALVRALRFFQSRTTIPARRQLLTEVPPPERSIFEIPPPRGEEVRPIESISVTQFRAYLACRYRFYLQHVLYLRALDDAAKELDGGVFGELVHSVLQQFGHEEDLKDSTSSSAIMEYLDDKLAELVEQRFGPRRRGIISLQAEQMRMRLFDFAEWQAERAQQGWQIAYSEIAEQQIRGVFTVDGKPITLKGRIDRIDWHPEQKLWQILDYKTGDQATLPMKAHQDRSGQWLDLQLPLYRHLAASLDVGGRKVNPETGRIELGYIALPKARRSVNAAIALWSPADLAAADETARSVIRSLWNGEFLPMADAPPRYIDDFAAICQDRLLDRRRMSFDEDETTELEEALQ